MPLSLGFDTSGPWCGAALLLDSECLAAEYDNMPKGQSEHLMPMLERVLADGGKTWADLDCIGVGIGPGNFTGVRIAVSAARGLALGLGIPAVGVTVLESLAYCTDGPVLACVDARRDQGYFQWFGPDPSAPFLAAIDSIEARPELKCIGTLGARMAQKLGAEHAPAAFAPGSAIARIALERFETVQDRPKPKYLRSADAAPPKDAPPVILS